MELEPRNLGIPLHPRNWFWGKVLGACSGFGLLLTGIEPDFGVPLLVSAVLVLPLLVPFTASWRGRRGLFRPGSRRLAGLAIALVLYLGWARTALAPAVLVWLEQLLA